jgi:hypothetical protein
LIFILGIAACNIPPRLPRGLLFPDAVELGGCALAPTIVCAGVLVGVVPVHEVGLCLCRRLPPLRDLGRGNVEFRLNAGDVSHGYDTAGQGADQFALLGYGLVEVIAHGAQHFVDTAFRTAKQPSLGGQGFESALFAPATEIGEALQHHGHLTISRI